MSEEKTIVVFRIFEDQVVALFPEIPASNDSYSCSSYAHIGQHAAANYYFVIDHSKPAKPEEYKALKKELESPPYEYVLDIRNRISYKIHQKRMGLIE